MSFKGLNFSQKLVYSSAVINVCVVGFVWVRRQFKLAQQEAREKDDMQVLTAEMEMGNWSESNRFKCFFAAQRYRMQGTSGPEEEEKDDDVQKMLQVLAQCREDLYYKLPAQTPAMRPLHKPPMME
eukprot:TRINITY_DN13611_c0_g1_i1.p2 TRINITY_DN13611_c0_g1~~TRINITY_DN13611_c0_g1_i1.p2  ORF type:complete len:126 (-),score=46.60 TRINITY_DN13611_c0_g1_i1:156-533(-)